MNAIGPLIDELVARRPVVIDGAWSTQLDALGPPTGEPSDLWNLTHPERVAAVAAAYVTAGSRIILTNTFRSNRCVLGPGVDIAAINREGAKISRRAAGARASVFGSIGPASGGSRDIAPAELSSAFAEQAAALAAGGADGLVVESMSDIGEAVLAVAAAVEVGLPVVASMSYDSGERHDRTSTGVRPTEAARRLADAGADAVGANCGAGIDWTLPICDELVAATDLPVWIKATACRSDPGSGTTSAVSPDEFAGHIESLVDAGASFVGGCCGTTPEFVAAIADVLR